MPQREKTATNNLNLEKKKLRKRQEGTKFQMAVARGRKVAKAHQRRQSKSGVGKGKMKGA